MNVLAPEVGSGYGYKVDLPDHRDHLYNLEALILRAGQISNSPMGRVLPYPALNQLSLGSCTAHGSSGAILWEQKIQGQRLVVPSRLALYYDSRDREGTIGEDSGAQIRTVIKVLAATGVGPEIDWPYDISKYTEKPPAKEYLDAKQQEALEYQRVVLTGPGSPVRTALTQRPVIMGFPVPEMFESPSWDPRSQPLPFPSEQEGYIGGHCTLAYDWDFTRTRFSIPVFKIRNSWGGAWGERGDFYMDARWFWEGLVSDCWIIKKIGAKA